MKDLVERLARLKKLQSALSTPRTAYMEAFVRSYGAGGSTSLASDIKHLTEAASALVEMAEAHEFMESEYQTPTHDQGEEGGTLSLIGRISHEVEHWKSLAKLADARANALQKELDEALRWKSDAGEQFLRANALQAELDGLKNALDRGAISYEFVKLAGRLDHTGDEGFCWSEDPADDRDALDGLIQQAREIMARPEAPSPTAIGPSDPDAGRGEMMRRALKGLLRYAESHECAHEATHRGGTIWTICDDCGRRWADDEGGFTPYETPAEIVAARIALSLSRPVVATSGHALALQLASDQRAKDAPSRPVAPTTGSYGEGE